MIRKNRKRHGLMITACAFFCAQKQDAERPSPVFFKEMSVDDFADSTFWLHATEN